MSPYNKDQHIGKDKQHHHLFQLMSPFNKDQRIGKYSNTTFPS